MVDSMSVMQNIARPSPMPKTEGFMAKNMGWRMYMRMLIERISFDAVGETFTSDLRSSMRLRLAKNGRNRKASLMEADHRKEQTSIAPNMATPRNNARFRLLLNGILPSRTRSAIIFPRTTYIMATMKELAGMKYEENAA